MVKFTDGEFEKEDLLFVKEDASRITRGIKDLLLNELNADRIEASKNKFDVSEPKDDIELHAIKEKSPHTLIHYTVDLEGSSAGGLWAMEREGVMQAEISCSCEVLTFYPGAEKREWLPAPVTTDEPVGGGLQGEEIDYWKMSKPYKVFVSLWHDKLYSKEIDQYSKEAKENVMRLHDLFREQFGVEKTIGASGKTHYKPKWGNV